MTEKVRSIVELLGEYPSVLFSELEEVLNSPMDPNVPKGVLTLDIPTLNHQNEELLQKLRENPELVLVAGIDKTGFRLIKEVLQVEDLGFMRMEIDDALKEIEQHERAYHAGVAGDGLVNLEFKKGVVKPPALKEVE